MEQCIYSCICVAFIQRKTIIGNIKETVYRIKKFITNTKLNEQNVAQRKRKKYIAKQRKRIKNKNVSIISSNCNGAFMLHDLGLRFNSPFVNLWIKPKDFLKLLLDFDTYMKSDIKEISEDGICYPIGQLRDITLYFQHYSSFEEARIKWNERKTRINKKSLFILFSDRDGCTYRDIKAFDKLPYKNKVVFTNREYHEFLSSFYIKGFENEESVGICSEFIPNKNWLRYYDQFDYVEWFNTGKIRRASVF